MANEQIRLKAEARAEQGSAAAGRLRRAGSLPAAVNRIGGDTTLVKLDTHAFTLMLRHHASEHMLVTLELDGQEIPALLREIQHDVITGKPIHADFGEISLSKKIRISIPLRLTGDPEGVKIGGGVLAQMLRTVEVECLPTEIVEGFDVDVSGVKLGQSLFVNDLKLGDAYAVITSKTLVVANVAAPEEEAAATPAAEGAAPAAPEVIAKGKKEEEGAAAPAAAGGKAAAAPAAKK
jgi:large subunit ribosomal protein L25